MSAFFGWEMEAAGRPLRRFERPLPRPGPAQALVRVAGCGVCHTDFGFFAQGVRTRHPLPLVLGHEISGYIEDAAPEFRSLVGKAVVVPAVIPCGACPECLGGRPTICGAQTMPGNDCDGGFASHVLVPARSLCPVPGAGPDPDAPLSGGAGSGGPTLRHFAVVADAVSTAYQSVLRSGAGPGGLAVIVGLGGVGGYAAQIARDRGAAVVAIDVDSERLSAARAQGAADAIDATNLPIKELRARVHEAARASGIRSSGWAVLECSGTAAGQTTAFGLLGPGATLMVVGFTLEPVSVRLSNLMAFDARALGNWGCAPEHYPEIVEKVLAGKIDIVSQTELRPLSSVGRVFDELAAHSVRGRVVLVPDES
jgi:6-hydroxycyclohex-1-ene-1-carbonyl-CoA dehydrogenase